MGAKAEWRYHLVIPHPREPLILLARGPGGWALPRVDLSDAEWWAVAPLLAAAQTTFGLRAAFLRWLALDLDSETNRWEAMTLLDNLEPTWLPPPEWGWVSLTELPTRALSESHHALLTEHLRERETNTIPAQRVGWARPGWYAEAEAWTYAQLSQHGLTPTGPVEQLRSWSISCLMRVPTTEGHIYFKALPPMFAREPRLTEALGGRYPGEVPALVAIHDINHWMLMRDFGGQTLNQLSDLSVYEAVLKRYVQIQFDTAAAPDDWLAVGCPNRRFDQLGPQIDTLFADLPAMLPNQPPHGLIDAQIADLLPLGPALKAACAELPTLGVPYTLEHGDFHTKNVAVTDRGFVFYDWTDGAITHPFVCLTTLLDDTLEEMHAPLTEAYLRAWSAYVPLDKLRAVLPLALVVGAAHIAVTYHDITLRTEPTSRWELNIAAPIFLKEILRLKDNFKK